MRYVALANALIRAGEFDRATVALCAHDGHDAIWRRWQEVCRVLDTGPHVTLAELPASVVLKELPLETAVIISDRYAIPF